MPDPRPQPGISDIPPPYDRQSSSPAQRTPAPPTTAAVKQSPLYPRVAVLLGVPRKWFVPLLLCRGLSMAFAVWWAVVTALNVAALLRGWDWEMEVEVEGSVGAKLRFRLVVVQLALAYLWAFTAAYLCHLFAASLMSRWLIHYSPLAVLVRLCSLSILLSYGLSQVFSLVGTTVLDPGVSRMANLDNLSAGFLLWVGFSIMLLFGYFMTQQDISVDGDKDDRGRRLVLRFKCLVAMAGSSLVSLVALIIVIRWGERNVRMGLTSVSSGSKDMSNLRIYFQAQGHGDL